MLLMGHVLILQSNLQRSKQTDVGGSSVLFFDIPSLLTLVRLNSTHFCACMTHEEDQRPDDENHNTLLLFPVVLPKSGSVRFFDLFLRTSNFRKVRFGGIVRTLDRTSANGFGGSGSGSEPVRTMNQSQIGQKKKETLGRHENSPANTDMQQRAKTSTDDS
jgi:hypothetical protein